MAEQGPAAWEEYRDAIQMCRDRLRKAKTHMQLKLARDVKNNKKWFYRHADQKRKARESVLPLIHEKGELATMGMEKTEVLNKFFASVFTSSQASHVSHIPEPLDGVEWVKSLPL